MRKTIAAIVAGVAISGISAFPAQGHEATWESVVGINHRAGPERDVFRGRVASTRFRCVQNRRVTVKKVQPGADAVIGSDRTDDEGAYSVGLDGRAERGRYYAVARRRARITPGHSHICLTARSQNIKVPEAQ